MVMVIRLNRLIHRFSQSRTKGHDLLDCVFNRLGLGSNLVYDALDLFDVRSGESHRGDLQTRDGCLNRKKGLLDHLPLGVQPLKERKGNNSLASRRRSSQIARL